MLFRSEGLAEKEDQSKEFKKEKEAAFVELIAKRYGSLTEQDVKNILIENKWLKAIREVVENDQQVPVFP